MGLCLILVAAFQLYLLRAAYVQPEILLTTIITITIAQLIETLRNPRWWNAVLSGLLLCAWFLTKASAQGDLGLFGVILIAKWLSAGRGRRRPYFVAGRAGAGLLSDTDEPVSLHVVENFRLAVLQRPKQILHVGRDRARTSITSKALTGC